MTEKFISIEAIAKRYPGATTAVFENLWLSMARGEFCCVIGHSGCGKTTVLNILAGLDEPSEGAVIVDGQRRTDRRARVAEGRAQHLHALRAADHRRA